MSEHSHEMPSHKVDLEKGIIQEGDDHYIMIGKSKVHVSDVMGAFGGTLTTGLSERSRYQIANPSPLGLSAFALTTFVLSIINFQGQGVKTPNVVVGLAFFYGGAVQLLAGMWEFVNNNTFAATALSSYGGFWLSYAAVLTPSFGILEAYADAEGQLGNALGFFLLGWCIFTWGLTLCTMKSTVALFSLFFLLGLTFLLLAIGEFGPSTACTKAGGIIGLIVAIIAWYNAYAGVSNKENSYITVHPIFLPGGRPPVGSN